MFYFLHLAEFQNSKFLRLSTAWTHDDPLEGGLGALGLVGVCPRRAVAGMYRCLGFRIKHSKELASRLAAISRCLCPYANEWGSAVVPTITLSPNAVQEGELSLPVRCRGSSDHTAHSWASALLHRSTAVLPVCRQTSKTSVFELR